MSSTSTQGKQGTGRSPGRVVFVRHGQSEWNADGRFTGWQDVSLTQVGREEAQAAGVLLLEHGLDVDVAFTSELSRAQETTELLLESAGLLEIPVTNDYRINERHYGALQGTCKEEAVELYGREQVKLWRNSYTVPPPPLADDDPRHPANDPRYASVPRASLPNGECLRDTLERCLPFWREEVEPELHAGRTVLISAHGHSIRALVKALDRISDEDIARVSMPNGLPLLYEHLGDDLRPIELSASSRAIDACGLPSPLNAVFLGGRDVLGARLERDAAVIGLDCPLPDAPEDADTSSEGDDAIGADDEAGGSVEDDTMPAGFQLEPVPEEALAAEPGMYSR